MSLKHEPSSECSRTGGRSSTTESLLSLLLKSMSLKYEPASEPLHISEDPDAKCLECSRTGGRSSTTGRISHSTSIQPSTIQLSIIGHVTYQLIHYCVDKRPRMQPHGRKIKYDGEPIDLDEKQESIATMSAPKP